MATIKQVSELAGVSSATVSRVINGSDRVVAATREKVKAAMAELGYQPNAVAQALASNRSNTIGMVISGLDGPFYGPMMAAVESELRNLEKHLIIASGHGRKETEREAINYLISRQVDGLILLTEGLDAEELTDVSKRIPVYLINQHIDGLEQRNIWLDNLLGAEQATDFLISKGHSQIVCIGGSKDKQDANERVIGFNRAMERAGLSVQENAVCRIEFGIEGGKQAMEYFTESGVSYSAVVAGSDETAIGIYEWAEANDKKIPEDFSVIGFDDIHVARFVSPKLTTIAFPMAEMAQACARMAYEEIYNKQPADGREFKPSLVVRNSVRSC